MRITVKDITTHLNWPEKEKQSYKGIFSRIMIYKLLEENKTKKTYFPMSCWNLARPTIDELVIAASNEKCPISILDREDQISSSSC